MGFVAGGSITPYSIVIQDTTVAAGQVILAASATAHPFVGVSQPGTRQTPLPGLDDGNAAIATENLLVYTIGDRCLLMAGGTVTAGDLITSDSSGHGITTTSDGNFYVGQALQSATANQLFEIRVMPGMRGA